MPNKIAAQVIYLTHPWAFNPQLSFTNAILWTRELRSLGYAVFSPILHAHSYWEELNLTEGGRLYLEKEDFLEWDLRIFNSMITGDGWREEYICYNKKGCSRGVGTHCHLCEHLIDYRKASFDSGVAVAIHHSAYTCSPNILPIKNDDVWESKGCLTKFKYAKKKFVRTVDLQNLLDGKVLDI